MSADQAKRLGRGLSALLGDAAAAAVAPAPASAATRGVRTIPVGDISPGRLQPRRHFAPEALQELAESIRVQGVLQPIVVRRRGDDANKFELIAGERRWRAAQLAKVHEIPALVRDLTDAEALQIGLVENLQRSDLNPVEEAEAYRRLVEEFGHTQEDVAEAVGKSRSHIANLLRVLELPEGVRAMVADGRISLGHAKLIAGQPDPAALAEQIVARGLSVRATEELIQAARPKKRAQPAPVDANLRDLTQRLRETLGLAAAIEHRPNGSGRLVINYRSLDQIDDVLRRLGVKL